MVEEEYVSIVRSSASATGTPVSSPRAGRRSNQCKDIEVITAATVHYK